MSAFKYQKDPQGIVTITMDMSGPVNAMNDEYHVAMSESLAKLESETDLSGVVIASAKAVFFAGGDLNMLLAAKREDAPEFFAGAQAMKADLRRL
jgi:3-hydroxyacyl-CoA dehydrogenase/enoyl-CoA hydratase/3-hydroxybutyryl-CoA epimerase